mgnify:CR=1 FL=1
MAVRKSFALVFVAAVVAFGSALAAQQAPAQAPAASAQPEVTFTKDIAPILQRSCQNCHRPGQVAPMSLLTYEDARALMRDLKAIGAHNATAGRTRGMTARAALARVEANYEQFRRD